MTKLKIPSLQHLSRNWAGDSTRIKTRLVKLAQNPPTFNYNPLFSATRDMLIFRIPYDQIVEGIKRGVARSDVRENFLDVLPLIHNHFKDVRPDFVQQVDRRFYPVGHGLMVPFDPPMIYGIGGKLYFPWFSFWRSNPLSGECLSLFVTLVEEVLKQDPDLETAHFEILDFSAEKAKLPRKLVVIDSKNIPRISYERKVEMLEVFAEGFFKALKELAENSDMNEDGKDDGDYPDQPSLF